MRVGPLASPSALERCLHRGRSVAASAWDTTMQVGPHPSSSEATRHPSLYIPAEKNRYQTLSAPAGHCRPLTARGSARPGALPPLLVTCVEVRRTSARTRFVPPFRTS